MARCRPWHSFILTSACAQLTHERPIHSGLKGRSVSPLCFPPCCCLPRGWSSSDSFQYVQVEWFAHGSLVFLFSKWYLKPPTYGDNHPTISDNLRQSPTISDNLRQSPTIQEFMWVAVGAWSLLSALFLCVNDASVVSYVEGFQVFTLG